MPIDRTWYNTLQNSTTPTSDDGSVWDKEDVGELLDAIDDAIVAISGTGCSAYHSTTQSVNNDTSTALTFDSEDFDVGNMHENVTNPTRITVPAAGGGRYLITAQVAFAADADGYRQLIVKKNGATELAYSQIATGNATASPIIHVDTVAVLSAGDYIEIYARHTAGAALLLGSATVGAANRVQVVKLSQ